MQNIRLPPAPPEVKIHVELLDEKKFKCRFKTVFLYFKIL